MKYSRTLLVDGVWTLVEQPTPYEMQTVLDGHGAWLGTVRAREVEAWAQHQRHERETRTQDDQVFLQSLRIAPWMD